MSQPRIVFAGDRDIACWVLDYLLLQEVKPLALLVSDPKTASHAQELICLAAHLSPEYIFYGNAFRQPEGMEVLQSLDLDYIVSVHFPYIIPAAILELPRGGVLNLHPAFLPYNRGWHTPSWALLEDTPIGATLHFMDEGIDTGDILHQKALSVAPQDTAHSLYRKVKQLELEVFKEAWPLVARGTYSRSVQQPQQGTFHKREELLTPRVQMIDLDEEVRAGTLIKRLRALTTNQIDEAAYYIVNGKRFRIQVVIEEELAQ